MRREALARAIYLAERILLASGMAINPQRKNQAIINGEPDRGPKAHSYVGALVSGAPFR